jgi:hypothetical protein
MPDIGSEHSSFPITAKSQIPQWYKDGESTYTLDGKTQMPGLKSCVPVLDALMSGYLVTTSTNIYVVKNKDKTISIDFDKDLDKNIPSVLDDKMCLIKPDNNLLECENEISSAILKISKL